MSHNAIALLMFLSMMALLATGQRMYAVIGFVGVAAAVGLWGPETAEMPFDAAITTLNWYPLLTLPMFVFMGYMFAETGIANDLYYMFHVWSGPLRGGLAVGTILMMVLIAAINGLSVAGLAIGATVALPEMLRRGYDKVMVTGVIQAGSTLGIMIPPSVVLVLYGMIARVPVGQLWFAGILPGLLLGGLFILYVLIRCWLQPELGPPLPKEELERITWGEKLRLLRAGIIPLVIFVSMTGLFLAGVTSLVESSAVGMLATTLAAAVRRRLTWRALVEATRKTLGVSCVFMWIIQAALLFSAVFDGLGASRALEELFLGQWHLSPWAVIAMMQASFLFMGTFLDDTAMLVIVAPLYVPLVKKLGFDLVWYGVLYTITCQVAYMTPPFGYNLFLMRAMAPPEITLADIYRSITPFVLVMILGLVIVMAFPQIATWLPELYFRRSG
ncbi:MAG: TRAP transporter large permease subunit [Armatimonadota bacterium]|nr:TRAP transporter large permease subunit [Armatimonadota bacterium]MDR5675115.1 TRAP transporter large permease subunit [Armatimonadota bacterium]MDR5690096.1 TRAP transporter large permease subunit [Armatimonadota bacterium]MDR7385880.1 TRAP transporter large permease subunit [Armatimonadota bacterium]MDR7388594.1 TRAP transporter large permease subunit [Armatimonadota bacterium]